MEMKHMIRDLKEKWTKYEKNIPNYNQLFTIVGEIIWEVEQYTNTF